jgi:dienelactone hydrolase
MDESTPPPGIPPEDWPATPASVRALLLTLLDRLRNLEAQIRQHSGKSSKPPSSDPPSAPPRSTKPQPGRPRGAPRINAAQIAIMGFSFGGRTALWTSQARFQERYGKGTTTFAAHLAFYPSTCYIQLAEENRITGGPIRIFHGAADNWTPIGQCEAYIERLRRAGKDAALYEYADALHGFDNGYLGRAVMPDALSPKNCTFVEQEGRIIDRATGKEATIDSPCVVRGVTVGYNADAHLQAMQDVEAFLKTLFQLK